jgi:asparagine synthase (glutamine-hydrolysing)
MCGIAGCVRYHAPPSEDRVRRMQRALAHRGPDGEGLARLGPAVLAHTRLALVDRAGGAQPMTSPDGRFTLTYNGEVYNYVELRAELQGRYPFRTRSDAEVVLAAYAVWGEAALARLNGMFAFFVWDAREERGFAARDRLGVKPLAWSFRDGEFAFASEAKALAATAGAPPRAHAASILEYLVAPCFSGVEHAMFDGIEYLQPGELLRVTRAGVERARWWDWPLDAAKAHDDRDHAAHVAAVRAGVERAVRRALRADVPIGLFLSGGLDSTLIAALAARDAKPDAFTIEFEDHDAFDYARSTIVISDDAPFAALAAESLGLARERVPVERAGLARDLAALVAADDALPAWEQELAQHHLARAAARRYKAVLVGDAADETHWGYHFLLDDEAVRDPAAILHRFGAVPIRRERLADPIPSFAAKYRALVEGSGGAWRSPSDRRRATTYLIVKRWLPRLLHNGDVHAMAHSLEARVPFADVELLDAAARVPPELGLRSGVEKWALREAARGLVPEAIRTRKKSALPKDQRAQAAWQREARAALDESPLVAAFVDGEALRPLLDPARVLTEAERAALFRVAALGRWAARYGVAA